MINNSTPNEENSLESQQKNDSESLQKITSEIQSLDRLKESIKNDARKYQKKARNNEVAYKLFSIVAFMLPLLVPLVNQSAALFDASRFTKALEVSSFISSALAVVASIVLGVVARLRLHENWVNYGTIAYKMISELLDFESKSGKYADLNDTKALKCLLAAQESFNKESFNLWKRAADELAELEKQIKA